MKRIFTIFISLLLVAVMTACSGSATTYADQTSDTSTSETSSSQAVQASTAATSIEEVVTTVSDTHESADDYTWDESSVVEINLAGDAASTSDANVAVEGGVVTITSAGTYRLTGTLNDGQIVVDVEDDGLVRLILNGVTINNSTSSAIDIEKAGKVILVLADGTQNQVTDAATYVYASADEDEPNAAIFSKTNLTISGNGSLTVNANYNDGISSKDGLIIAGGNITVNAVDDGIRGKDYLVIKNGTLTINAGGDGLKSDNEEDITLGYISILDGTLTINSGTDGIDASTLVSVSAGQISITSGGGSSQVVDSTTSAKGIKAAANLAITDGTFVINSADDALHTNGNLIVDGGNFTLSTGDDGMHADTALTINDGTFTIDRSYEGIESVTITINGGVIYITSSDDGINGAGGVDSSGTNTTAQQGGGPGGGPGGRPGGNGGGPGMDNFSSNNCYLYINGGYIWVNAGGDGLDVNGGITMTNGLVVVNGPTENMNGALDYTTGFNISGGTLVAVGSIGMAQAPDTSSSQNSILANLTSMIPTGTLINLQNSAGENILTFAPAKAVQSIAYSSASLVTGEQYTLSVGGSSTGTMTDGLYDGGSYSGGETVATFTISDVVTMIGSQGMMRP